MRQWGVQCRHTRDFSKISVNKINHLRKSDFPKIFRREKSIFSKKKRHAIGTKKRHHSLLVDPPKIGISKISEDHKKKRFRRLFR
jgi:hypothetical protein